MTKFNSDILALLAKVEAWTEANTVCGFSPARSHASLAEMWLRRARRAIKASRKSECLERAMAEYLAARAAI